MHAVIRVDSSIEIGSGHVMRCLTLAEELKDKGYDITFISREHEGNLISFIELKGYKVLRLKKSFDVNFEKGQIKHAHWLGTSQIEDAKETLVALNNVGEVDLLIVDHYGIDISWETYFKDTVKKIFVIDDLADRKHYCDFLLDQNYYPNMNNRYNELVENKTVLLLGPKYSLLRREFKEIRNSIKRKVRSTKRILIFFGGSDPTNETVKTLQILKSMQLLDITIDVVVGASNPNKEIVQTLAKTLPNVNYYCQVSNMAELMISADFAICAGGSTTWERYCLGLPGITIAVAKNQVEIAKHSSDIKVDYYLGEYSQVTPEMIQEKINYLLQNPKSLELSRKLSQSIVDGLGTERIVHLLL